MFDDEAPNSNVCELELKTQEILATINHLCWCNVISEMDYDLGIG